MHRRRAGCGYAVYDPRNPLFLDGTMTTRTCVQCGHPLPENAKFCGQCGAVTAPASKGGAQTILQASPAQPAAPLPAAATPNAGHALKNMTMVGFGPSPMSAGSAPPPHPVASALASAPAPAPAPTLNRTMLGVASMPQPAAPAPAMAAPQSGAPAKSPPLAVGQRTMLGVALPGIAPIRPGEAPPAPPPPPQAAPPPSSRARPPALMSTVALVAAPAPLTDLPAPLAPRIVRRAGVPLAGVALVTGGLVLVGGVAIALLWRGAQPISAQPHASPDGKDVLHLTCDPNNCKDGTVIELDGVKSAFAAGESDLTLAQPLRVGDNALALHVTRPGLGRDEVIKLVVPVAYRVHADVSTMSATPPSFTIHAEALPGSEVRVDGKPVALDANGVGAYAVDERAAAEGPVDESRVVSVDVPYVVTPKGGAPQTGTVSARVVVAPLRVDAPGTRGVFDEEHALIAGRAAKGASVTVDGAPVPVAADGAFEATVATGGLGERTIEVRGGTSVLVPRTVHVVIKRVASLAEEAKAFEGQKTVGYDAVMQDLAGSAGQPIVVDGEVFESRGSGHRTLVLIDDRRGCAKGPCLARVVVGKDLMLAHGEVLRAYGRVARAFTTSTGQSVPEVEADFVVRAKR
jgi:hypothetical protein